MASPIRSGFVKDYDRQTGGQTKKKKRIATVSSAYAVSRYTYVRRRSDEVDDRHQIRDPLKSVEDCKVFTNSILKTRVPELFLTEAGLAGHALQIEYNLRRLTEKRRPGSRPTGLDGVDPDIVIEAVNSAARIRDAIRKSAKNAPFYLKGDVTINIPFTNETVVL